jgi:hypothetical protein
MKYLPAAALVLMLVFGSLPTLAGSDGTRRTWDLAPFSWIKRIPAEPGAPPNGHPLQVDAATLAQALGLVHFVSGTTVDPLFEPAEVVGLAKAMSEALSLAEPGEDLELLSTTKRGQGILSQSPSVTARVFVEGGKLNIIVHDARLNFAELYYFEFKMPKYESGSRTTAGVVVLKAAGTELPRADWAILPLAARTQVVMAHPVSPPQPVPAASLEERLLGLKRLRDQNLITEEDYAKKKQELLKEL